MSRRLPSSRPLPVRLCFEHLEDRATPTVTATLANGTLMVRGDDSSDGIVVKQAGDGVIMVNGPERKFKVDQVRRVEVYGGAGDDYIEFVGGNANGKYKPVVQLSGGAGDDTLVGGIFNETLFGGDGDDLLVGGSGNNVLQGNNGNDILEGGKGNNLLIGGAGDDLFYGGDGRNTYRDDFQANRWTVGDTAALDVEQGTGGTCAVLATLASAAAKGQDLDGRISYLGNNTYRVKLYDSWLFGMFHRAHYENVYFDGTWYDQDAQPSHARDENGSPTGAPTGEFWTLLYQRAVLQEEGVNWRDQKAVENWSTTEANAQSVILGSGSTHSVRASDSSLPQQMRNELRAGAILTAGTPEFGKDKSGKEIIERNGIISSHAYAVIDVYQLNGAWRIKLYNPWAWDATGAPLDGHDDGMIDIDWKTFTSNFDDYCKATP